MAVQAKIRDSKGTERVVSLKAFEFMRKSYTLLGYVDNDGNPVETPAAEVGKKKVVPVVEGKKRGRPAKV